MNVLIEEKGLSKTEATDIKSRLNWTVIDGVVYDITNYIDMPIQHINNDILKAMRRIDRKEKTV